ncbi:MAG: hypothetical protein ACC662_01090 [Planctomycetota bacterium]
MPTPRSPFPPSPSPSPVPARPRDGLGVAAALTDAAVAGLVTWLLAAPHASMPGGARRAAEVPIFAPLALLALLDAGLRLRAAGGSVEVTVIRAFAALFAAGALFVDQAWLQAALALWLGASALFVWRLRSGSGLRRGLALLCLLAVLLALLSFAGLWHPAGSRHGG